MVKSLELRFWEILKSSWPRLYEIMIGKRTAIVFLAAGGVAVVADTGTLYLFKGVFGFALIPAVAVAFVVGFCASFVLQKFWTFENFSVDKVHTQASLYFIVAVGNFFLTIALMYFLVEVLHFWYILSKIAVAGGIACVTFFIYKIFIFKNLP